MEELTQYIFPPLADIVEGYNPPEALLMLQYHPNWRYPAMMESSIVDLNWTRTIQLIREKYPDRRIRIHVGSGETYYPSWKDWYIRVVTKPELVDAFRQIYGERNGNYPLEKILQDDIKTLYREITETLPEEGDEEYYLDEDPIDIYQLSEYFLSHQ